MYLKSLYIYIYIYNLVYECKHMSVLTVAINFILPVALPILM